MSGDKRPRGRCVAGTVCRGCGVRWLHERLVRCGARHSGQSAASAMLSSAGGGQQLARATDLARRRPCPNRRMGELLANSWRGRGFGSVLAGAAERAGDALGGGRGVGWALACGRASERSVVRVEELPGRPRKSLGHLGRGAPEQKYIPSSRPAMRPGILCWSKLGCFLGIMISVVYLFSRKKAGKGFHPAAAVVEVSSLPDERPDGAASKAKRHENFFETFLDTRNRNR
ncbi:hypothetical protein Hoch_0111 [Haliangium ochraceum DSM 14365]|uniref:Uncharacterized protein n=1 Tax=Haliangium ochraceum (strain DSM 14365 / JCM 11303 / SMP-2) TaxID=502025 RepID=D0LGK6_HALO1|nr:hypothetical protein Hoch_0111 [Haliangium ochraceum DSM 14365]